MEITGELAQKKFGVTFFVTFASLIPTTVYSVKKLVGIEKDTFTKFAACPRCTKLYRFDDLVERNGDQVVPKTCTNRKKRKKN